MIISLTIKKYFISSILKSSFNSFSTAKVALILSGCGVYDGSEIHESSSCLMHLSRNKAEVSMFAPNIDHHHIINHTIGEEIQEKRNVLDESSRIARGKIANIESLQPKEFDALVIPGGFGVAKNLCNFAFKGPDFEINKVLEKCMKQFINEGKPIGLCCISPILISKLISGVEITMGGESNSGGKWPYIDAVENVKKLGVKYVPKESSEIHIDQRHKIVTTPAYMCGDASLYEIYTGIGLFIDAILKICSQKKI